MSPLNAIVIDDEALVTTLLKSTLSSHGFNVVTAGSAAVARNTIADFDADIAIIDLDLGAGPSGIDIAHYLYTTYPHVARLVLTNFPDLAMAGHKKSSLPPHTGMFPKESISDIDQLLRVIEEVVAGNVVPQPTAGRLPGPLANLTVSQISTLRMLAQGFTVAEIADRRHLSSSAIEKSITAIYKRLGLSGDKALSPRTLAIRTYIEHLGLPGRSSFIIEE